MKVKTHTEIHNIVEIDEVLYHQIFVSLPDPRTNCENEDVVSIYSRIQSKIYTDGEFVKAEEILRQPINKYYITGIKYNNPVDTLIKKNIHIKNASYIVKVTIAKEWLRVGKGQGWFDVIKNTEIFLNDKKDKKALKEARKTILMISRTANFNSIFETLFTRNSTNNTLDYKKIRPDTYQLIKKH